MSESKETKIMRSMAWERAKGELNSILFSFYDDDINYKCIDYQNLMNKFIKDIEHNGYLY